MCAQFNPFTLFLPGQPTPTGPGKRVKFVKGLIPRTRSEKEWDFGLRNKYRQGSMGAGKYFGAPCRNDVRVVVVFVAIVLSH